MTQDQTQRHILVCDDEPHFREMIAEYLRERSYSVAEASNATSLLRAIDTCAPDLILLDVHMPGADGLEVLRDLRRVSEVPVIMLTAASEVVDRILGLEMGADDYIGKPVDLRELEARIRSTLRRQGFLTSSLSGPAREGNVAFGTCQLELDGARLFDEEGNEVAITAMEFSLLKVFAENPGKVLNRDQLLEKAHNKAWEPFDRSIDLHISRLRKKVERNPGKPEVIRTVRGIGYVFG